MRPCELRGVGLLFFKAELVGGLRIPSLGGDILRLRLSITFRPYERLLSYAIVLGSKWSLGETIKIFQVELYSHYRKVGDLSL